MDIWLQSLLSALAVWRITHLVSQEEGPWALCLKFRRRLGRGFFGQLLHCFYCLSMWVSLPFAVILPASWSQRLIAWFAFSGAAILLERLTRDPLEIKISD
jgi:hypothetical protein